MLQTFVGASGSTFLILLAVVTLVLVFSGALPAAWLAAERGRSAETWVLVGLLLGPMAVVLVGLAPRVAGGDYAECPECREPVRVDARRCPHCHVAYGALPAREAPKAPVLSAEERDLLGI